MQSTITRWVGILFVGFALHSATTPTVADGIKTSTTGAGDFVAIQGYDAVAYFTQGKAVKGSPSYEVPFDDSKWRFANASHKEMFIADPERYLPQYGGSCAGGMAMGVSVPANPENWMIVDGKLYMIAGEKANLDEWKVHAAENIKVADKIWAEQTLR
jgi:hypothetical protein